MIKFGDKLRDVTKTKRLEIEMDSFQSKLLNEANSGIDHIAMHNIETEFPILYSSGELWEWLNNNKIGCTGGADINGKNASYTFFWQ